MAVLADGRSGANGGTGAPLPPIRTEKTTYAVKRYTNEVNRLYGVLNKQLRGKDFVTGRYSIADMAIWGWVVPYKNQGQKLEDFPHLKNGLSAWATARP